jgi:hypothetical protein
MRQLPYPLDNITVSPKPKILLIEIKSSSVCGNSVKLIASRVFFIVACAAQEDIQDSTERLKEFTDEL